MYLQCLCRRAYVGSVSIGQFLAEGEQCVSLVSLEYFEG